MSERPNTPSPYKKSDEQKLIELALSMVNGIDLPISESAAETRSKVLIHFLNKMTKDKGTVLKMIHGIDTGGKKFEMYEIKKKTGKIEAAIDVIKSDGYRVLRSPSRAQFLRLFLPYEEESFAREIGLTCPYDVILRKAPNFNIFSAIEDSMVTAISYPAPFESVALSPILNERIELVHYLRQDKKDLPASLKEELLVSFQEVK